MEQDTIVMQDIFKYNQEGVDERGRAVGHFMATGIRPTFMSRLESSGVRLPVERLPRTNHAERLSQLVVSR